MRVKLHQPAEGKNPGDTVDVSKERGDWLIAEGYASVSKDDGDHAMSTTVDAKADPTLAENREGADEGKTPGVDEKTTDPAKQLGTGVPDAETRQKIHDTRVEQEQAVVDGADGATQGTERVHIEPAPETLIGRKEPAPGGDEIMRDGRTLAEHNAQRDAELAAAKS